MFFPQQLGTAVTTIGPPYLDILQDLVARKAITSSDEEQFRANYLDFQRKRTTIQAKYPAHWVAAVSGDLYAKQLLDELQRQLQRLEKGRYAYVEYVAHGS